MQSMVYHTREPRIIIVGNAGRCLIDKDSMAFAYDKVFKDRPIIGCGIIINSNQNYYLWSCQKEEVGIK